MYYKIYLLICIVLLGISSCVSGLYLPNETDALKYNTNLETLTKGRELYIEKCGNCHNLYLPSTYTNQEWEIKIAKMQKRAKIDDIQRELISKYLETNSKK